MGDQRRAIWDHEAETFDEAADHGLHDPSHPHRLATTASSPTAARTPAGGRRPSCGTGTLTILLAQAGHQVHGVDFAPQMLAIARTKAMNVAPAPRFTQGDVAAPTLPAGSFDVVLSRHVLWVMPDPQAALQSWNRVLRFIGSEPLAPARRAYP